MYRELLNLQLHGEYKAKIMFFKTRNTFCNKSKFSSLNGWNNQPIYKVSSEENGTLKLRKWHFRGLKSETFSGEACFCNSPRGLLLQRFCYKKTVTIFPGFAPVALIFTWFINPVFERFRYPRSVRFILLLWGKLVVDFFSFVFQVTAHIKRPMDTRRLLFMFVSLFVLAYCAVSNGIIVKYVKNCGKRNKFVRGT